MYIQVDLGARTLRLFGSKNHDGRVVVMTETVHALLSACVASKSEDNFIFTWPDNRPVKDFRSPWAEATEPAKLLDAKAKMIENQLGHGSAIVPVEVGHDVSRTVN